MLEAMARLVVLRRGGSVADYHCPHGGRCEGCAKALKARGTVIPCIELLEAALSRYEKPDDVKWFIQI